MSKNTPAICYTSAMFKAIEERAILQTNKNLLLYDFWTDLMRSTSQAVQLLDLINHLSFANDKTRLVAMRSFAYVCF